jgi:DNA processing protein
MESGFYAPVAEGDRPAAMGLYSLPGVGPARARRLQERYGSFTDAWQAGPDALLSLGLNGPQRARTTRAWRELDPGALAFKLRDLSIEAVFYGDARYPVALAKIHDPPLVVYIRGELRAPIRTGCAFVGTRRASAYGQWMCKRIVGGVAREGWPVISGLAVGIDKAAHEAALAARGPTWAVLAGGLDQVYPPEHTRLAARIVAQGGILLSEYLPGTPTVAGNFLARNRLISGLAAAVVIVEASRRSGAMSTARHATEQGREVLAVPGRCGDPGSAGPHDLIRDGAIIAESASDVLDVLSRSALARAPSFGLWAATRRSYDDYGEETDADDDARDFRGDDADGFLDSRAAECDGAEALPVARHLVALLAAGPRSEADLIDALLARSGPGTTRAALLELELDGVVERLDGAIYSLRVEALSPPRRCTIGETADHSRITG